MSIHVPEVYADQPDLELVVHDLANLLMAMAASVEKACIELVDARRTDQRGLSVQGHLDAVRGCLEAVDCSREMAVDLLGTLRALPAPDELPAFPIDELLDKVVASTASLGNERVTVRRGPTLGAWAWGERDSLARGLINVVVNAIESIGTGAGVVEVRARRADGAVRIEVCDDGPGIAPALIARYAERGVSGRGSSGLGLFISFQAAQDAGGDLSLGPGPDGGTVATFVLREAPVP